MAEIAEPDGNTRQSVYAVVKNVKAKLDQYESELKIYQNNQKLGVLAGELATTQPDKAQQILDIIGK